jgi:hypothetical protein
LLIKLAATHKSGEKSEREINNEFKMIINLKYAAQPFQTESFSFLPWNP